MPVIMRRKRPITVATLCWDGTNDEEAIEFCGIVPDAGWPAFIGPRLTLPARVWNSEERCWISVPAGHHLIRGPLGELYPLSPAALALTYQPLDDADALLAASEEQGQQQRALNTPTTDQEQQ